jgi:hypothetical protein
MLNMILTAGPSKTKIEKKYVADAVINGIKIIYKFIFSYKFVINFSIIIAS